MTSGSSGAGAAGDPLVVPAETERRFGPIIALIRGSESMNMEERQYWINILPAMTPEQVQNLEQILNTEREQLAAIDAKYANPQSTESIASIEAKMRTKKQERSRKEEEAEAEEHAKETDILSTISSL